MQPDSTEHPVSFPVEQAWRKNPRLSTGKSIAALLIKAGFTVPPSQ